MTRTNDRRLLFYALFISTLFLAIGSRSSPLYPMNDWEDVHIFFTMGRSVTDGLVLYRDIYDQKGPLLYFLFALASLISRTSFVGVFCVEVGFFTAFLYFSGKLVQLYLGDSPALWFILALMAPAVTLATAFANGSSAEQYCLWLFPASFYYIDLAIHQKRLLKKQEAFFIGVGAGFALYVKFTILGFFLGLALFVLIWYLCYEKDAPALPGTILSFLGGIAAVSAPIILYFVVNGALEDFYIGYFYNNLFLYQGEAATVKERLVAFYVYMKNTLQNNLEFTIIDILGGAWLLVTLRRHYRIFTAFFLGFAFLAVATLGGGRFYPYYTLTFAGFAVYGFIAAVRILRKLLPSGISLSRKAVAGTLVLLLLLLIPCAYVFSDDTYFMAYDAEDLPQFQFAEYVQQREQPTLLYYGFLDGGFYFSTNTTPPCRYIGWLNIPLEDMSATQEALIQAGAVDFVVTRTWELDSPHYRLVMQGEMPPGEEEPEVYFLYEKIS